MDFGKIYNVAVKKINEWIDTIVVMLPNLAVAILIIIIFFIAARIAKKITINILSRFSDHEAVNNLIARLIFISAFAVGFFFALGILQLDEAVFSLLAGVGILGLALGFAFQDMAANFISGIALALEQPFKVNDIIESNSYFGKVTKITLRTTAILTLQGQKVIIPNKEVFQNPMINYSSTGMRRADVKIGVSYGDDLDKVKKIALEAVKDIPNQVEGREPELFYEEFADSSVNFVLRVWIHYHVNKDYKKAVSDIIQRIKNAFDKNDIMLPFPVRTLDFGVKGGEKLSDIFINIKDEEGAGK